MQQGCCPYRAGEICSRYSGKDGQRTGEKWSDVQEAEDSGRPTSWERQEGPAWSLQGECGHTLVYDFCLLELSDELPLMSDTQILSQEAYW